MSIDIMSLVWKNSPQEGGTLLVLLALADWADEGGCSWHSLENLAKKARLSPRQTSRVLKILVASGELELPPGPRTRRSPYRIRQNVYETPMSGEDDADGRSDRPSTSDPYVEPSKKPKETTTRDAEINEVWGHYLLTFPRKRLKLDSKHRKIIGNALDVRPVGTCKKAISGLASDPFYMGENDRATVYDEIHQALRGKRDESNEERIDKMAAKAPLGAAVGGPRIDPVRVQRRLETVQQNRSSGGFFEPGRAKADREQLEGWGFTLIELDEAPWVRLQVATGDAETPSGPSGGADAREAA